jgi:hypothetical protein
MKEHLQHPVFSIIHRLQTKLDWNIRNWRFCQGLILKRPSPDIDIVTIGRALNGAESSQR